MFLMFLCAASAWTQDTKMIRIIRDPHNGMLWQLERGAHGNSGGPGRMVLLSDREASQVDLSRFPVGPAMTDQGTRRLVIRSGDRLVIEERSSLVDARLEAISLGAATQGAEFNARLLIGGKILRAVALGPGHAAFATGEGVQQ
jgi:hypothetical protein